MKETQTLKEGKPSVKTCRVPPMWRGRDEKGAMARPTTVITLPRIVGVAGGETNKGELKQNTGAKTRETKVKTLPQAIIAAGGTRQKAKTHTK